MIALAASVAGSVGHSWMGWSIVFLTWVLTYVYEYVVSAVGIIYQVILKSSSDGKLRKVCLTQNHKNRRWFGEITKQQTVSSLRVFFRIRSTLYLIIYFCSFYFANCFLVILSIYFFIIHTKTSFVTGKE